MIRNTNYIKDLRKIINLSTFINQVFAVYGILINEKNYLYRLRVNEHGKRTSETCQIKTKSGKFSKLNNAN